MFTNISVKMYFRIYFVLILCVYNVFAVGQDECTRESTCGSCISSANCVWCADENMMKQERRCISLSAANVIKNWCKKELTVNPKPVIKVDVDKSFDDTIDNVKVQLRPQHMIIKTRPGVVVPITISFKPAQDFPLDVYYIMDISDTMRTAKEDLQKQALEIYSQLTNYTNNVRLGIGSFVEKPGYPYVDLFKKDKHMSYAFKNHLSLTDNMSQFTQTMNTIEFGANYDDPEAGLDALMQAMKCEKELGWRKGSRRIIVLCTDSTYHSAGDGRALGVIKPNDMKCHLENNTMYSDELALTYDYPSVSQINTVANQGNFIIIFAAKRQVETDYTELANHILGAKYAALQGGQDAVAIIKKAYMDSASTVRLIYNLPPFIQLTFDQNCDTKPTTNCESTPEQRIVTIKGYLTIKYCPLDGQLHHELVIKPVGIKDKVTIQLDAICKCDCEKPGTITSPKCNNAGFLQCGICSCLPERSGVDCLCNSRSSINNNDTATCKMDKDDKNWCSGHGSCICGKCECNNEFSGDFCQYNENSCPHKCSKQGNCYLGKCVCDSEWTGEDCSCTIKTDTCIAPHSKKLCSGNGVCKCGGCECQKLAEKNETYSGRYCDVCDDCTEKRCKELEPYVVCNVMKKKSFCDIEYNVTSTTVQFINKTDLNSPEWYTAKWCKTKLENDSYTVFKYQYEDGNLKLGIQDEAELPPKANIFIAVGSAIGTVLLIGIITLIIWKILVDLHDKREYQKFSKESKAAGFDVSLNPLYTPPAVNFTNPAYECN